MAGDVEGVMMANDRLAACPFCKDADAPFVTTIEITASVVICDMNYGGCGARAGVHSTQRAAVSAWNRCEPNRGGVDDAELIATRETARELR